MNTKVDKITTLYAYSINSELKHMAVKSTMSAFGWPTAQRLILLSSPPVARVRPLLGLSARQLTFEPWATNSPTEERGLVRIVCIVVF